MCCHGDQVCTNFMSKFLNAYSSTVKASYILKSPVAYLQKRVAFFLLDSLK